MVPPGHRCLAALPYRVGVCPASKAWASGFGDTGGFSRGFRPGSWHPLSFLLREWEHILVFLQAAHVQGCKAFVLDSEGWAGMLQYCSHVNPQSSLSP